jgi:TonB family protein
MGTLVYFIQVNVFLLAFYAFYYFLLKNETFHKLNRVFLVGSLLISVVLPTVHFDSILAWLFQSEVQAPVINYYTLAEVMVLSPQVSTFSILDVLQIIYFIGFVVFASISLYKLTKTILVVKNGKFNGQPAFSFFGTVYLEENLSEEDTIWMHEYTHSAQMHYVDLILFEIAKVVFWFNPVVHFAHKSIGIIHEFLADQVACQMLDNRADYAGLLFQSHFNTPKSTIFIQPFFNQSILKTRIGMLMKNPSKKASVLKYGLLLPLFLALMTLSSLTVLKDENVKRLARMSALEIEMQDKMAGIPISRFNITVNGVPEKVSLAELLPSPSFKEEAKVDFVEEKSANKLFDMFSGMKLLAKNLTMPRIKLDTFPQKNPSDSPKGYNEIFTAVEQNPEFEGGASAMYKWMGNNINYPREAQTYGVEGRVFVKFVVERDGSIGQVYLLKGIGGGCDEEAIRVIKSMPKWKPGYQNGKPVAVYYNMPVVFKLSVNSKLDEPNKQPEESTIKLRTDANSFSIRGNNFGNPVYYLNNEEISNEEVKKINPDEIVSISVLKGDDAIKAKGEKGANGLIYITTKKK